MSVQTQGSITLEIGDEGNRTKIVLNGTVGNQISVGFRAKNGDEPINCGTFESIIESVAKALCPGYDFETAFKAKLSELEKITELTKIVNNLRNAALIVTDLAIEAEYKGESGKETYVISSAAFGFRVEFPNLELGPIKIAGFGVLFEYTPGITPIGLKQGKGKLTTSA